jgi:hypothetical protein
MSACNIPQNSIAVSLGIDWHGSSKQEAVKTGRLFFGQIRTLELRNSARIVQTGRFAFSPNAQASAYLRRIHTTLRKRHSGSVTGIVCPRLTIGDPYSGSNRQRGSIRVINQNAGTENTEATDAQGRAGVGRKRGVLNDTYRHVQSADSSTSGEIGLIDECAVEEGGIAHAWRTRRAQLAGLFHPAAVPPTQEKLASTSAFARGARAAGSSVAPTTARNKPNDKLCD